MIRKKIRGKKGQNSELGKSLVKCIFSLKKPLYSTCMYVKI